MHQLSFKFTPYLKMRLIQHLYFYINVSEIKENRMQYDQKKALQE